VLLTLGRRALSRPALSGLILLLIAVVAVGCSTPSLSSSPSVSASPLPSCPDRPNCIRTARTYDSSAEAVFNAAQRALDTLGPAELQVRPDRRRADAVYRVALVFKDDMAVAVTAEDGTTTLHARSESRVGYNDLGVNERRVARFFEAVAEHLPSS